MIIKALVDYRTPPFYHKRGFVRRCFKSLFLFRIMANFWCHYDDDDLKQVFTIPMNNLCKID